MLYRFIRIFSIIFRLAIMGGYVLLLGMVVFKGDLNDLGGGENYTLFNTIKRYPVGSEGFLLNVVGNIVMFVPFGFFVGYYFGRGGILKLLISLVLIVGVPAGIEFAQLQMGRVFDIDDILLNAVGGVAGYLFCITFR